MNMPDAQPAAAGHLTCCVCGSTDPPPEMTCIGGADHGVGRAADCRYCGRLRQACAARPCQTMRAGPAWRACTAIMARTWAWSRRAARGSG